MDLLHPGNLYLLNRCTKYLAREAGAPPRHSYGGHLDHDPGRARFLDGWRFPVVDPHREPGDAAGTERWNAVTFVWRLESGVPSPDEVQVAGDFAAPHERVALARLEDTPYWAATVRLPVRQVFHYLFVVDGAHRVDDVNPRLRVRPDKTEWSFFWTDACSIPVTFEGWEALLLRRLTNHILPFNTREGRIFLSRLDPSTLGGSRGNLYRFDLAAGAVNFIDKLVAGPERHHLDDYRACLEQIDRVLRIRNPLQEPRQMEQRIYEQLYDDLAAHNLPGWDYGAYDNPSHFLRVLRRHTYTGVFAHPKYGGNPGGLAWDYLAEAFGPFDWRQALETPLGTDAAYLG